MPETKDEPGWNRKNAPIVRDPGGMMERQKRRLAEREAERKRRVQISLERAQAPAALEKPISKVRIECDKTLKPQTNTAPKNLSTNVNEKDLKDRAVAIVASFLTTLDMGLFYPDKLTEFLDEVEDLPDSNPLKAQLMSIITKVLACKTLTNGRPLCEQLRKL